MPSSYHSSTTDLLKKVRKIEIRTKALSHQIFAGEYHSAFKGRGMAFSEVREYQWGDDVRSMDWNVTARLRTPLHKGVRGGARTHGGAARRREPFRPVRNRRRHQEERLAEIAAVLSYSAILNNDKVGALFFSDHVEKFISPKKGRTHLLHIIREMLELQPTSDGTDIGAALRFLTNGIKKKCTAFLLSDMLDVDEAGNPRYEDSLKVAAGRHDLSVIKVHDPRERTIPNVGLVHVKDSESGSCSWVNTGSRRLREAYRQWFAALDEKESRIFNRYRIDNVDIATDSDYVRGLMALFNRR